MICKTVVPAAEGLYSAFPTFACRGPQVYVYYRQGRTDPGQSHGILGRVRCWHIATPLLFRLLHNPTVRDVHRYGNDTVVFAGANEMDAVVSRLGEQLYSLCTRFYHPAKPAKSFVSFAERPDFGGRREVKVEGVDWLVFYGKALALGRGYVFTAYGALTGEEVSRPLLLHTDDLQSFGLLSHISSPEPDVVLNESSLVFDGQEYIIFIRQDSPPFGIWTARSADLVRWSKPQKLFDAAQAPMACVYGGRIHLAYRDLSPEGGTAVSLCTPLAGTEKTVLDFYRGSPYDGGYSDLGDMAGHLTVFYCCGNEAGEPSIKMALFEEGDPV